MSKVITAAIDEAAHETGHLMLVYIQHISISCGNLQMRSGNSLPFQPRKRRQTVMQRRDDKTGSIANAVTTQRTQYTQQRRIEYGALSLAGRSID